MKRHQKSHEEEREDNAIAFGCTAFAVGFVLALCFAAMMLGIVL